MTQYVVDVCTTAKYGLGKITLLGWGFTRG
jgi:hypothetical protein